MKNNYLLAIVVGIIVLVANQVLSVLLNVAFPLLSAEYAASTAFRAWSDPLMNLIFLYPILTGVLATYLWLRTRKSWKSGADFGVAVGLFVAVPTFIVYYSNFLVSPVMVLSWALFAFVNILVAGLALEKLEG
ncbi:hypothetical protein H0O01_02075 [Candidatus Micrarchaeota archaeon]|nr:hypothetical protein [Candidatus Micrarchaeota archaeon]